MSNSEQSRETEIVFRHSTLKMAAMIFKRSVYESRRKPRGLLRPKTRANLKDAAQVGEEEKGADSARDCMIGEKICKWLLMIKKTIVW